MSKENKPDLNEAEVINAVERWLSEEGYPLEMKVASKFTQHGFGMRQALYLEDPIEGKQREIDLLTWREVENGWPLKISCIIECKVSPSPVVIFKYPQQNNGEYVEHSPEINDRLTNREGQTFLKEAKNKYSFDQFALFKSLGKTGYSMITSPINTSKKKGKSTGKELGYQSLMQVTNATASYCKNIDNHSRVVKRDKYGDSYYQAEWVIPLIVFSGLLLEAYILNDGNIELNKVNKSLITWNSPVIGNIWIRVYSEDFLDEFIGHIDSTIETFLTGPSIEF